MIVIISKIVQDILICNLYNLILLEQPGSILKWRTLISMYTTLWVDGIQTASTVDGFETMIVGNLTVKETSESTLLVGGVQSLQQLMVLVIWLVESWQSKILVDQHS